MHATAAPPNEGGEREALQVCGQRLRRGGTRAPGRAQGEGALSGTGTVGDAIADEGARRAAASSSMTSRGSRSREGGYVAANRGNAGPVAFAYHDTRPLLGCMLEVVTKTDAVVARFAEIARAAEGWDGKEPIRGGEGRSRTVLAWAGA